MSYREGDDATRLEIKEKVTESKDDPPTESSLAETPRNQPEVTSNESPKRREAVAVNGEDETAAPAPESPAEKFKDPMKETPAEAEERAFKLRDEIRALVAERYQIRDTLKKAISSLRMEERQRRLMDLVGEQAGIERSKKPGSNVSHSSQDAETPSDPTASDARDEPFVPEFKSGESSSPGAPLSGQKRARSEIEPDNEIGSALLVTESEQTPEACDEATSESQTDEKMSGEENDRTKKRSKNLFGHLMGHLQKAKEHLEREKDTKQAERQQETELRVKEKIEKEKKAQSEVKIQALKDHEFELMDRLKKIQSEIEAKELAALVCHLESHYKSMQNFIRTKADPTIFWKPKIPSQATDILQRETSLEIESKIRSISKNLQPAS